MSDPRPPRFPYVAALLCAACVGAAAWTWMRYSYAWEVTPDTLREGIPHHGGYVLLRWQMKGQPGYYTGIWSAEEARSSTVPSQPLLSLKVHDGYENSVSLVLPHAWLPFPPEYATSAQWSGRAYVGDESGCAGDFIVYGASRFHGASVAGLVVGAMGVFVFGVALRQWLRERTSAATASASSP